MNTRYINICYFYEDILYRASYRLLHVSKHYKEYSKQIYVKNVNMVLLNKIIFQIVLN